MKPYSYKRIIAYLIDIIIVTSLSTMLTYFLPENKEYNEGMEEYTTLVNNAIFLGIESLLFQKSNDLMYTINRSSITTTIVTTVLTIFYFVVFTYFMNGQTIGKKLMKIKIVSNDRKKLTMNNFLIRGLIINSILMNVLGIIILLGLNKATYLKVNDTLTYVYLFMMVLTLGMVLFREDKRGLHDILANTKVINAKPEENLLTEEETIQNEDSKIKDATIINEEKLKKM